MPQRPWSICSAVERRRTSEFPRAPKIVRKRRGVRGCIMERPERPGASQSVPERPECPGAPGAPGAPRSVPERPGAPGALGASRSAPERCWSALERHGAPWSKVVKKVCQSFLNFPHSRQGRNLGKVPTFVLKPFLNLGIEKRFQNLSSNSPNAFLDSGRSKPFPQLEPQHSFNVFSL